MERHPQAFEICDSGVVPAPRRTFPPPSFSRETTQSPSPPRLELVLGDLTEESTDAIVCPAPPELVGGGLVNLAIHRVAGPNLARACADALRSFPRELRPGDAVITPAYGLPSRFVIHSVATSHRPGDLTSALKLAQCHRAALRLARENGLASIAFPAFGIGAFGYPVHEAAPAAVQALISNLAVERRPALVRLVLFGPSLFDAYLTATEAHLLEGPSGTGTTVKRR